MSETADPVAATPRRGRSNAIVTYQTLEALLRGVERVDAKMDHLYERVHDIRSGYTEHEARIRALELALARASEHEVRIKALELTSASTQASRGTATWLWQAVWPVAAVIIAVLSYLK